LPQLTCQRKVVSCRFAGGRRDDEEVLKNPKGSAPPTSINIGR